MYEPLMQTLANRDYKSVACDQRGYSKHARPGDVTDYNYNKLMSDVFAVAEAVFGGQKFHLVGHDHGAVLGWHTTGSTLGKERILSYSALSIPHIDAFSAGLFGPTADVEQQCASQYFTMFVQKDSSKSIFCAMGLTSGFSSCDDFQKALWWYNGAMDAGVMSMPPLMSSGELWKHGCYGMASLRLAWGGNPNEGYAAKTPTGNINVPAFYVCGKSDSTILCNRPYALKTKDYCKAGYTYLEVDCGHDVLGCDHRVEDGILSHIEKASPHHFSVV
jgi:pimeloyl-ACP methyl ester carboxylesterase